ncbi:MAG: DUF624 domain-containing protein [Lachnospiraceae bacterium]|nr:DUF624 domain-containing protein [Lachnospiraceae bacterium]
MFKLDSPLMNFLNKVADIMILNVMFMIFSIPVFTIGASFSAAYYMGFKMVKNEETYIVKGFWKAFRENFKQATAIWLIVLVILGVLMVDYRIIAYSGIEFAQWIQIAVVTVTVVLFMGLVFIFPLQARFVNPVKNTIKNAFLMALSHLPTALLLVAIYALPVVVFYFVPQILPVLILMAFGVVIYVKSFLLLRVFKKYEDALVDRSQEADTDKEADDGIFAESDRMERGEYGIVAEKTVPDKVYQNGRFVEMTENHDDNEREE